MERKRNKIAKLHIRKGDTVMVISGRDKGETGEVVAVYPKLKTALVQGRNLVTKHKKPDAENPDGAIVKIEAPLRICKLQVMVNGERTRIGRKLNKDGKLRRYAKKTGEFIKIK